MGRAIRIQAIRRATDGGPVEALGAGGFWVASRLWGDVTRERAQEWANKLGGGVFPTGTFHWTLGDLAGSDGQAPPPDQEQQGDQDQQDQDQQQQQQQQQDQGGGEMTVEDIIRRIAGEMDEASFQEKLPLIVDAVNHVVDGKLADFQSKGDGDFTAIITRVEVKKIDGSKYEKDGIFHHQFDKLLKAVAAGQHVYLPGPPGTGKSHAAEQVASVLGWGFSSLSLGPTTPESRIWGGMDAHGKFFEPPFVRGARYAQDNPDLGFVFCADELDNGNPGVIATFNSAMANGWFTAPNGDVVSMGKNFVVIGAANTYGTGPTAEFSGRNKLDAATLDRFIYLPWDTDLGVEKALVHQLLDAEVAKAWLQVWRTCRKNVKDNGLKVFVTMRGAVNGARLIASGFSPTEALDMVLLNKLPEEQRRKVQP